MTHTAEHYTQQLAALLPQGTAWPRELDTTLMLTLAGLAPEFARIDARTSDLIEESDPRTVNELLEDYERAYGLPEKCAPEALTIEERVNAVVEKVLRKGDQSRQYFIDVAERLGYTITITEFDLHTVESTVDAPMTNEEWRFVWQVNVVPLSYIETVDEHFVHTVESGVDASMSNEDWQLVTKTPEPDAELLVKKVDDGVDTPLHWYQNKQLECVINRLKPAHTLVLFNYYEIIKEINYG